MPTPFGGRPLRRPSAPCGAEGCSGAPLVLVLPTGRLRECRQRCPLGGSLLFSLFAARAVATTEVIMVDYVGRRRGLRSDADDWRSRSPFWQV